MYIPLLLALSLVFFFACSTTQLPASSDSSVSSPPRFSPPLVGDDGNVYSCYGDNLFAFHGNGTVAWALPLGSSCRTSVAPVADGNGQIYLITQETVLRITTPNFAIPVPTLEVFFGPGSSAGGSGKIIGICIGIWNGAVFINVERRGIFAFSIHGKLLWSAGPLIYRFGYVQGCKVDLKDCHFNSPPSYDHCEGSLYVSNNEGLLYSIYTRSPHFKWIQDLSPIDKEFIVTPGNNGQLYVTFFRRALVMSLDAVNGNILWQNSIGPLREDTLPLVDSNGWISIGSLDGSLYSISPNGDLTEHLKEIAPESVISINPILDNPGFAVYVAQTVMERKISHIIGDYTYISAMRPIDVIFTMLVPATGAIYWTTKYSGELSTNLSRSSLRYFEVDERIILGLLASLGVYQFSPSYTTRQRLAWTCSQAKPRSLVVYDGNERTILFFLVFQLFIIVVFAISVRFCCIFWQKKKLQEHDLGKFIKKRRSLHRKRKECNDLIDELEQKTTEDAVANEVLEQLGEAVRAKEAIDKKFSSSYSLGRDRTKLECKSVLPLFENKNKNYSFRSGNQETVTVFNTLSDSSSGDDKSGGGNYSTSDSESSGNSIAEVYSRTPEIDMTLKSKAPMFEEPSSSGMRDETMSLVKED